MAPEEPLPYRVVDVFTQRPLEGNPLAVFPDASKIDGATMQRIAQELNLAETTFILPPTRSDCVARVRIFTPRKEMAFAGHPTIGTGFVLLNQGVIAANVDNFLLEEAVGPVAVRVDASSRSMLWLTTPPIAVGRLYDPALCAKVLGLERGDLLEIPPQRLSAGNPTAFVALRDKNAVDRAWLDPGGMKLLQGPDSEPMCVFVFTPTEQGAYSRMFAPSYGIVEDPATGSSTGPLAAFMIRHGLIPSRNGTRFISEQGTKMGRRSLLHVHVRGESGADGIDVGGHVTPVAFGSMQLGL